MFSNKKKEEKSEDVSSSQVDQDLIVHNMPSGSSRISKVSNISASRSSLNIEGEKPHNFKVVGALIIGFGVILVGVLIFLSYRFLINPKPSPESQVNNSITEIGTETEDESRAPLENDDDSILEEEIVDPDIIIIEESDIDEKPLEVINEEEDEETERSYVVEDTDQDGLTDEEEIVLGTDINNKDSDSDGYLDLAEINNGYNPAGDGTLEENENLIRYYNPVANYSILHPKSWALSASNNDYTNVFTLPDNSVIQISVQANAKIQAISTWYSETVGEESSNSDIISTKSWDGIMGSGGNNFYLTDKEKLNIYVISYYPIVSDNVFFPNIYKLMIDSVVIE